MSFYCVFVAVMLLLRIDSKKRYLKSQKKLNYFLCIWTLLINSKKNPNLMNRMKEAIALEVPRWAIR